MAKMKKILSLAMVAVLCTANVIPALADEAVENVVDAPVEVSAELMSGSMIRLAAEVAPEGTIEAYENTDTGVTVTTTTTTDDDGKGTVTVTIKDEWDNKGAADAEVSIKGEQTTVTTTEDTKKEVITTTEIEGSETQEWAEKVQPGEEVPDVTVDLVPGESTEETVTEKTTEVTGDVSDPDDETDENYDYTETTTTVDRTVTAETSTATVTNEGGDVDLKPVGPDIFAAGGSFATGNYELGQYADAETKEEATVKEDIIQNFNSGDMNYYDTMKWNEEEKKWVVVEEKWTGKGDYQYAGWGEQTEIDVKYKEYIKYKKDADGNLVLDENGNAIIESSYTTSTQPIQFVLHDKDGNIVFAYCIDLETGAVGRHAYDVSNLEDSDYYADEESEDHLRAIALSGYWGSANEKDENGKYATGSIEAIRQELAAAFAAGELTDEELTFSTTDENGEPVEEKIKLSELMGSITEGEALAVTQAAIWTYANGNPDILDGTADSVVTGTFGDSYTSEKAMTRLDTFYKYLISITAEKTDNVTTVINEKNNVEDVSLTVKNKNKDHSNNQDDDDTNDVYDTDLNFKLAFIPGANDDLLVCVTYKDLDGNDQTVIKRLAGENDETESFETITADEDGNYIIPNLVLREYDEDAEDENKGVFNFDLKLEGIQYLEQGVYVYSPVGGRGTSQTFVGVAEGNREVNVTTEMSIKFEVDEEKNVVAEHKWKKTTRSSKAKPGKIGPSVGDPSNVDPTITTEINEEGVPLAASADGLVEILDEEVPLAAAPETGDNSIIYVLVSLISLAGALVLALKRKTA